MKKISSRIMRKVILDASPLIFLAKAGLIHKLQKLSKEFFITAYVKEEIEWPEKQSNQDFLISSFFILPT